MHAWEEGGKLHFELPRWKKEVKLVPPRLPGRHNLENAMAAGLLGFARGLKPAAIQKAFKSFKGVEHRLEECGVGQRRALRQRLEGDKRRFDAWSL